MFKLRSEGERGAALPETNNLKLRGSSWKRMSLRKRKGPRMVSPSKAADYKGPSSLCDLFAFCVHT